MHRNLLAITRTGFLGSVMLGFVSFGCGGNKTTIRQQAPTAEHPEIPRNTVERLEACVNQHGHQLDGGSWAFRPTIQVDREMYVVDVNAGDMPQSASDLAACTRIALGAMAIPSQVFNLRSVQPNTATNEPTVEQRLHIANPAVAVIVAVGLSEIVLEAGAITILFAVTVKVVDKAVDDVADMVKRRRIWRDQCADDYTNCIASPAGRARGNNWNMTRCGTCREVCEKNEGIWPSTIPLFPEPAVSCY